MNSFIVDSRKVDKLVLELGATSKQATLALRSTVSKMATWLRARTLPELSRKLSMQQKIVRRRLKAIKFKQSQQGGSAKLFLGLNPVALIYLQPKTTPTGISAQGGRIVEGGFIPKWSKSKKQVFKRLGKKRLPIEKQETHIKDAGEKYIANKVIDSAAFEKQFWKVLEHELTWRMNK